MTRLRLTAAAAALALVLGCQADSGHGAPPAAGERPIESFTHYAERSELFVEFPALVVGLESPFAAHLTTLPDFQPLTAGRVAVVLTAANGAEERFETSTPSVPGIFRPVAKPAAAGERSLAIEVATGDGVERHDLGTVRIVEHAADVKARADAADAEITYLKEQQWRTEFATAAIGERTLRLAVAANGTIRARTDGEAQVDAPVAGRLLARGSAFPRLGMDVRRDQVLAAIAPRLGTDVDVASLDLALQQAGIASDLARRERQRLEGLLTDQAVSERRVIDAQHEQASADAALTAARRRLEQFRGTQRAGASDGASVVDLRSPIDGTVVAVDAAPGAFVREGSDLFRIVDLGRVWLQVQIPEGDVGRVQDTRGAWFTVDGFAHPFEVDARHGGHVVALAGLVDSHTRTVPLVFELANPDNALRIGMYARVHVLTGEPVTGLAIPISAVIEDGGQQVAYIQASGEAFERRPIRPGVRDGDWVQVLDGVAAGERVVTRGAYQVRLAAAAGSLPAHGHAH
ncbi:MAG: efflux RND transporter periplasmic adaptor subunit [Candidatus Binatia bacterium]